MRKLVDGRADDTLVILPTYNEATTLEQTIDAIGAVAPAADVLVIDDASPDGTGRIAERIARTHRSMRVIHRAGKLGLGTAYVHGFRFALERDYRVVVTMDSDGSHRAHDLPKLLEAVARGAGASIGTRWVTGGRIAGWPWYRRAISKTGTAVARIALRSRLHDLTSGFRALDTTWLRTLDVGRLDSEGYAFQVETAWRLERLGCPIAEVPITFIERTGGRSKMGPGIVLEALANTLRWGWQIRRPHRRSTGSVPADDSRVVE